MVVLSFSLASLQLDANIQTRKHVVKKGETIYSISKKYGLNVNDVLKANRNLSNSNIRIGQLLLIPIEDTVLQTTSAERSSYKPIFVPSTPDTPYRDEDMRERNVIPSVATNETGIDNTTSTPVSKPVTNVANEYPFLFNQYSMLGMKMKKNKGAANYLTTVTSGNQNLAFYNEAETNSIIRVTNLLNHKTIFVKVVGKVPSVDSNNEIVLKLSNKAAEDLGAVEEKFLVEIASYFND